MTRHLAPLTLAFALITIVAMIVLGAAPSSTAAHALPPGQGAIGRNPVQEPLTASYSIIGGGGSQAKDILTYISNGAQQVVALTGSPTVYMADSGSQWSAQTILNGSTATERWITTQDVGGTIGAPLTVAFSYYHQFRVTFNFNVTHGGTGYTTPSVSLDQLGSAVSVPVPGVLWVDASAPYSYPSQLVGSSSSERWVPQTPGSGTITQAGIVFVTYNHEYLVSSSYSIIGGGSPAPPTLSSTVFGAAAAVPMSTSTQTTWLDAGANFSFSSALTGTATERWTGTVLVKTQAGDTLSMVNNGTVSSAISITPVYYHQFLVNVSFTFVGGSLGALSPPSFAYRFFGNSTSVSNSTAVWVDGGTAYALPETICCPGSPTTERWQLNNSTTGTISSATRISSTYFHQFMEFFSYSIVGQLPPSPSGQPGITYAASGNAQQLTLLQTPQGVWADAGSTYSATTTLPASTATERWSALSATGSVGGPAPANSAVIAYTQQYLLTMVGGGLPTQWANAGNTTFTTPGVFGRSQGTGSRVVSYQIDSEAVQTLAQPEGVLSIPLSMEAPHTITFRSVTQFQVALDAGAAGAVSSITPPTVPGDDFWYDSGSSVQVVLNGTWGRASGTGERITSIAATAQATKQVNGLGPFPAYSTASLLTPVSITTTSVTQYEVVLNGPAMAALVSVSPPSTFSGDAFWYDSGSPPVTVALNGVYSRAVGTGYRLTSWELDSGPVTKLAAAGTVTVVTSVMTSPQFVNATGVLQYQVTMDGGGASALSSTTSPSIPSDKGWYDASSPVGVIMNGVWGRASGTGQRLASFSVNGGAPQAVASTGLVTVLNLASLSSPESITTSVVTQYQVVLDSGAASALASMTSTPIPQDNYWFDSGTPVAVSLNGIWGRTATTGSRLVSYSVNQGAPTAVLTPAQVQGLSLSGISGPESISTKAVTQYRLTTSQPAWASITNPTLPGDAGWFDSGTAVKAVYSDVWNQTSTGTRQDVVSYTIDGGPKTSVARSGTGNFTIAFAMSGAHSVVLTSVIQYSFTVVGPGGLTTAATANHPSQTGDSYFDSGSKVTFAVQRVWNATSKPGARDVLTSYSLDGGSAVAVPASTSAASFTTPSVSFTRPHLLALNASAQYEVTFQFFDALGRNPVVPSDVQLGIGNTTVDVQGPSAWIANGTAFSIINVTWEGAGVGPTPPPSYRVEAAPLNVTVETRVYQASLKMVDLLGLPLSGAQVSMTLANGTTVMGTTKPDGTFSVAMVPLGTFTAKVSSLGSSAQVVGDAASSQPVAEGRVILSLTSLFAIVAVAAAAAISGVVFLRLRKRGKGATAQVSGQK